MNMHFYQLNLFPPIFVIQIKTMGDMRFKGTILLLFTLLMIGWFVFVTYCIAIDDYAASLISLSTMVVVMALAVPVLFKKK